MDSSPLDEVARRIQAEIEAFVVPQPHPLQLGEPLPPEWFRERLQEMRAALVQPYFLEVEGEDDQSEAGQRRVIVVAEDQDILLAFDPHPEGDFALIFRSAAVQTPSNIRGGAIDCFMSA